ncbi:hypothetical protein AC249_AIPGENE28553 [Exaiptasia diaphana]|nr:hypothetical protein AC249_AIPGENE28553 [Exaiptasia diaphana]
MKRLLRVIVLSCVVAYVVSMSKEKRGMFDACEKDADCGKGRCCIKYIGFCAPKRAINQSCNFKDYHGCGCEDGLYCQVSDCFASFKYYRCLPPA